MTGRAAALLACGGLAAGLYLGAVLTTDPGSEAPTRPVPSTSDCAEPPSPELASSDRGSVVALVNGVAITEADLALKLEGGSHAGIPSEAHRKQVLESLIGQELLAQRARSLGLHEDPAYQQALRKLGAQARGFERQELSQLLLRNHEGQQGAPTEADARAYFEANRGRIATQIHVLQILRRSEEQAIEARNAIQAGTPFDEVAASLFPGVQEGKRPWDLGFMSFYKVPEPWRDTVYALKPGETSGIIRGANERFWLIKLVETREDPDATFDNVKNAIIADLTRSGGSGTRAALESELRKNAQIEILDSPSVHQSH